MTSSAARARAGIVAGENLLRSSTGRESVGERTAYPPLLTEPHEKEADMSMTVPGRTQPTPSLDLEYSVGTPAISPAGEAGSVLH